MDGNGYRGRGAAPLAYRGMTPGVGRGGQQGVAYGGAGGWQGDARAAQYAPQAQQPQQGYGMQQAAAPQSAQYGYGQQQQPQAQQQAQQQYYNYAAARGGMSRGGGYGYTASYAGASNAQSVGGYYGGQQEQQSQYTASISTRGGRFGGGGGAAAGMMSPQQQQQAYANNYAARGGYYGGAGYGQQQQQMAGMMGQHAMGGGYYGQGAAMYGGGYGGGVAPHMAYGAMQSHGYGQGRAQPYYGRGVGGYGRGGRGGGMHAPRQDVYHLVHIDSFAKLDDLGRKGVFDGIVDDRVLMTIRSRSRGGVPRVLVIVAKQYLAAVVSIPRSGDDIVLSSAVASEFLDVGAVVCDDGSRLVEQPSGSHVAKHVYVQLRAYLRQVTAFDKAAANETATGVDVVNTSPAELLRAIVSSKATYTALAEALQEDSERSTALFDRLLHPRSHGAGDAAATAASENEEKDDTQGEDGNAATTGDKAAAATTAGQNAELLSSAQGVRLLSIALRHKAKRRLFFDQMMSAAAGAQAETPEEAVLSPGAELFKTFFCCMLTPSIIFECFRVGPGAAAATAESTAEYDADVDALCACFARYGILVVNCNGGSCMLAALVRELRPGFGSYESRGAAGGGAAAASAGGRGGKRIRESEGNVQDGATQQQRTEDGNVKQAAELTANVAPSSLDAFVPAAAPSDWRLFYAAANAFVSGELTAALINATSAAGSNEDGVTTRVRVLCEHIVGCRAVQVLLPHFADFCLRYAKEQPSAALSDREVNFHHHCEIFLQEVVRQADKLTMHSYGNYVVQTLITEFAPRAVTGTIVDSTLRAVIDGLINRIFDVSVQKFSSNCVERAINATRQLRDGTQVILRMTRATLERGEPSMLEVASHQFGNYVIRHLCERLTAIATGQVKAVSAEELAEAKVLEQRFFKALRTRMVQLQGTSYGVGLVSWLQNQQARLGTTPRTA